MAPARVRAESPYPLRVAFGKLDRCRRRIRRGTTNDHGDEDHGTSRQRPVCGACGTAAYLAVDPAHIPAPSQTVPMLDSVE